MKREYSEVDVFCSGPFSGNPLAVIHDSEGLSTEEMLAITRWMNFSETTFLFPPRDLSADYYVRIFTPSGELPFAGHPTLGSCRAWLDADNKPKQAGQIVQECGVGLVELRQHGERLAFAAPPRIKAGPLEDSERARIISALNIDPSVVLASEWCDNGPGWQALFLRSAADVLAISLPKTEVGHFHVGVAGPHPEGSECQLEVRAFFNDATGALREDPVTGSLNAALGQWLLGAGHLRGPYVAAQGTQIHHAGRVHVEAQDEQVWIGGNAAIKVRGQLSA